MSEAQTVTSQVEVGVDPETAFRAFTEEMDLWWMRGPINFFSEGHRVVEMRCEGGVGGRIMEVLDSRHSDQVTVLGRITAWEPPSLLSWESALDDVFTQVSFSPTPSGTLVRVQHSIEAGGEDKGGTAWSRVIPTWFGRWVVRREDVPHEVVDVARLSLGVRYDKPVAAAHFLTRAFGFASVDDLPDEEHDPDVGHGYHWIEFRIGNSMIHLFPLQEHQRGAQTHLPWIYVDDLDAHYIRAKEAGAVIVEEPHPFPGDVVYVAADPEGNHWRFSQARPTQP